MFPWEKSEEDAAEEEDEPIDPEELDRLGREFAASVSFEDLPDEIRCAIKELFDPEQKKEDTEPQDNPDETEE